jgi:hypothetical protein
LEDFGIFGRSAGETTSWRGIAMVEEEGMARRLWIKFRNDSVFVLYTPFFVCLASGHLHSQTFCRCVSQDVYFLKAFAQA